MTLHISRDLVSLNAYAPDATLYFQALFLYGVMGFTQVGNTNFDVPSYVVSSGSLGSINMGVGLEYAFSANGYVPSGNDINRILVVKSTTTPRMNSGLFRVTSINTASNYLILDYRSSNFPTPESNMSWKLFGPETSASLNAGTAPGVAGSGYRGDSPGVNSRTILQSPFNTMQIRLTKECDSDLDNVTLSGSLMVQSTMIPGFSGSVAGDFAVRGSHIHLALWNDAGSKTMPNGDSSLVYRGTPGLSPQRLTGIARFYMWGDDTISGSFVVFSRAVAILTFTAWAAYGFTEDETVPSYDPLYRIFAYGQNNDLGGQATWSTGTTDNSLAESGLVAYGFQHKPVFGAPAPYSYVANSGNNLTLADFAAPHNNVNAGDSPFIGATELVAVEVYAGTWANMRQAITTYPDVTLLEPRRMGIFPIARLGRGNFGLFTTTNDTGKTWIHMTNGIYLPWSGSALP